MGQARTEQKRERYRTIAFRCSDDELREIELRVELSGLQKQDYILKSILHQKIVVVGNELLFERLRFILLGIKEELVRLYSVSELDMQSLAPLRMAGEFLSEVTEEIQY